jgi:hypothetical protein
MRQEEFTSFKDAWPPKGEWIIVTPSLWYSKEHAWLVDNWERVSVVRNGKQKSEYQAIDPEGFLIQKLLYWKSA